MSARKTICNLNFSPIRLCSLSRTTTASSAQKVIRKKKDSWSRRKLAATGEINCLLSIDIQNSVVNTYPVSFANSAGVLEVPGPGQAEGAALEVPVGEHVGQAKGVIILLWKRGWKWWQRRKINLCYTNSLQKRNSFHQIWTFVLHYYQTPSLPPYFTFIQSTSGWKSAKRATFCNH